MKSPPRTVSPSILLCFVLVALTALPPAAAFAAPALAPQSANTSQFAAQRASTPAMDAALSALVLPATTSSSSAWLIAEARLTALLPAGTAKVQLPQLAPRTRATTDRATATAALIASDGSGDRAQRSGCRRRVGTKFGPLTSALTAQSASPSAQSAVAPFIPAASPIPESAAIAQQSDSAATSPAALAASAVAPAANNWAPGNIVGLNCGTEIHTGNGDAYPIHTVVPEQIGPSW